MSLEVLTALSGITGVVVVMVFLQVIVMLSSKLAQAIDKSRESQNTSSEG